MSRMLKLLLALVVFALPLASRADNFDFTASGSGAGFSGSGSFTTTQLTNDSYQITGISGTGSGGSVITGLIAPGMFNKNDNLLFPFSMPFLDFQGFSFTDLVGNTAFMVNIYSSGSNYIGFLQDSDGFTQKFNVNFNVTPQVAVAPTPEPSSLLLLGTGIGAIALMMRRRLKSSQISA